MLRLMFFLCAMLHSRTLAHEGYINDFNHFLRPTEINQKPGPDLKNLVENGVNKVDSRVNADPLSETDTSEVRLLTRKARDLDLPNLTESTGSYSTGVSVPVFVNSPKGTRFKLGNVSHVGHHKYYNSFLHMGPMAMQYHWVDFDKLSSANVADTSPNQYKNLTNIVLSFEFPFYGHKIQNLTLTTSGYIGTGNLSLLPSEKHQYIAPLMANFFTGRSASSVQYLDNGTAFMAQWSNVVLEGDNLNRNFTFQATLMQTGDIIFGYKTIPIPIPDITDSSHPVKVGISDAYFIDGSTLYTYSKTLYEYHKVEMKNFKITNGSFIILEALPTCLNFKDCHSCTTAAIGFDVNEASDWLFCSLTKLKSPS